MEITPFFDLTWKMASEKTWGPSVVTLGQVTYLQLITLIFKIIHLSPKHLLLIYFHWFLIPNYHFFYMYTNYTIHGLFCILQYVFYHIHITVHIKVNQWLCYSFLISFIHEVLLCRTKEFSGCENASTHIAKFEFSSFLKMSVCGFVVTKVKYKKFRCQNESNLFFF